jgi:two-component system nitrate/nitrite response regulator NarL
VHRVLIADDRVQARDGLRALLATVASVTVVGEAADGLEALRLVEDCRPDVVLMDVRMPLLDGLEATQRIKARWPAVRVVVLTVHAAYRQAALAAGADSFLVKGSPDEALIQAILESCGGEQQGSGKEVAP